MDAALIDGGTIQYDPFYGQPQVAAFHPASNTFTNVQNMAHGRWYPTVLTLGDGRVMAFSVLNETGGTNTAVEFYTVGSGWSLSSTPHPGRRTSTHACTFYPMARCSTLERKQPLSSSIRRRRRGTRASPQRTTAEGETTAHRCCSPLTLASNYDAKVIIMGGHSPCTNTSEIIDLGAPAPAWVFGPNMSEARIEMNAVILPDGRELAVGGSDPRLYHSVALLLPDATVRLAGGNPSRGTYVQQMEVYQPPYLFDSTGALATRLSITGAPSSSSYGNTFTVQTPDAASIAHVVLVRNGTVTHAFGMDQREVEMSSTAGSGALTVTAPPNGNIAPPGYYMLFILNNSGVPSVATFVQVISQPDFSVTATPSSRTVAPGTGTSYNVSVAPSNGFNGNVTFSATGLPSGATASFNPSSVTGPPPCR